MGPWEEDGSCGTVGPWEEDDSCGTVGGGGGTIAVGPWRWDDSCGTVGGGGGTPWEDRWPPWEGPWERGRSTSAGSGGHAHVGPWEVHLRGRSTSYFFRIRGRSGRGGTMWPQKNKNCCVSRICGNDVRSSGRVGRRFWVAWDVRIIGQIEQRFWGAWRNNMGENGGGTTPPPRPRPRPTPTARRAWTPARRWARPRPLAERGLLVQRGGARRTGPALREAATITRAQALRAPQRRDASFQRCGRRLQAGAPTVRSGSVFENESGPENAQPLRENRGRAVLKKFFVAMLFSESLFFGSGGGRRIMAGRCSWLFCSGGGGEAERPPVRRGRGSYRTTQTTRSSGERTTRGLRGVVERGRRRRGVRLTRE